MKGLYRLLFGTSYFAICFLLYLYSSLLHRIPYIIVYHPEMILVMMELINGFVIFLVFAFPRGQYRLDG